MTEAQLPPQFATLVPYSGWALPTETARRRLRMSSSMQQLTCFYGAMLPHMAAIIDHLNTFALQSMPPPQQHLLNMLLSMAEVATAVEVIRHPGVPDGIDPERFVVLHDLTRAPAKG